MRQRLNLILLGVADVQRAATFYEALGWRRARAGHDEFVLFDLGGVALALQPRAAFAADAGADTVTCTGFPGFALAYVARQPEEVQQIMARAAQLGAVIVKPASRTAWGHAGYFRDHDGHLIEVVYEDGWHFDANDNLVL
ncbi:VOC family protein [Chitiniphilus purpureus]|uniref:VOC family protein n=1 Tax=Chitiniphilus purpureus TaxID=2981137 RepID=A0ABY6DI04_9NEIS|nr:VOC family protein [Chitiniphilus sp. CD1]UXY13974.1 VOC family protein [Chitiniphilus sp. CD1]